ncbi:hypothetical protein [Pseudoxanthomonas koreensis]|uniref:hypothetical protein n=1 Tax=Pseudoxanthomonas koreensis TaxID=266061 RepID=UPI0035A66CF7
MDPTRRSLRGLLAIALLCACSQALAATPVAAGQVLTLVLAEERAGGEDARATYFQGAFPLSQEAGMRELASLRVEKVLLGDGAPQGVGLYAWPGREAAAGARANPRYLADYGPLRSAGWEQLQAVEMDVAAPQAIDIDRGQPHTLALLWLRDRAAYDRYYAGTAALRERLGARTVLMLPAHRYETLTDGEVRPPDLVVLVRWASREAIDQYPGDAQFLARQEDFQQGVERLEWYRLGAWD